MGIIGRRLVSVLSLVVTIVTFCAAYAANVREQLQLTTEKQAASKTIAGLACFFKDSHIDFLREHHLLGDYKFPDFLECWEIVHEV